MRGSGSISSATLRGGDAGNITIRIAGPVRLDHGFIASDAGLTSTGDGGTIDIEAKDLSLGDESQITSGTFGTGTGGRIAIRADTLSLDRSAISSANDARAEGGTGSIAIAAGDIRVANGSRIGTESANRAPAGKIEIAADHVRVESPFSRISSSNFNETGGDAGSIAIRTRMLSLLEGGRLETTAAAGAAGDIAIAMPGDGLILLASGSVSSGITTSSGPGTGGRILISAPRAIVSHGAQILALGEQRGANVQIESEFFIRSADRLNRVAVDGDFLLEAQAGDVSSGTVERDLSILDASGVLRGQCAVARATGQVSQLVVRPTGAFAPAPPAGAADDPCR